MKPLDLLLSVLTLGASVAGPALSGAAQPTVVPPAPAVARPATLKPAAGFDTFRVISERNIFDPNRTGRSDRSPEAPAPRMDYITLVGTMHYDKGLFAFFDGSAPDYRKSLHEGDKIEQYTVTHIRPDGVDLRRDAHALTLAIGRQLQRPPGGDWAPAAADAVRPPPATADNAASTGPTPALPADASEILKKLMEQRQKQLKP